MAGKVVSPRAIIERRFVRISSFTDRTWYPEARNSPRVWIWVIGGPAYAGRDSGARGVSTFDLRPSTLDVGPWTLDVEPRSAIVLRRSKVEGRRSIPHPAKLLHPVPSWQAKNESV